MNVKPFQTIRTEIICKNCDYVVTTKASVTLAQYCLHLTRQNLNNSKWLQMDGTYFDLDEDELAVADHLLNNHRLGLNRLDRVQN